MIIHSLARQSFQKTLLPLLLPFFFIFCFSLFSSNAFAGLILGAELRFTYEDNVVGLLSDQPRGAGGGGMGGMS
ncbi:MAG TPA: hypothetical protein VF903_03105, partial [Nitrospirota bacterium]